MTIHKCITVMLSFCCLSATAGDDSQSRVERVAQTQGLVAFWDFRHMEGKTWTSHHDAELVSRGYPVFLRRIGDPKAYTPSEWPYTDEASRLSFDTTGPFGHAINVNQGYIFAEVPRSAFDQSPLDLHGRKPFTLIAWMKFTGKRHMVTGIWDEGGWDKYGGRRQVALFGGLFGSKGVIAHISATGAASYPQSTVSGSQYARCRAIDPQPFENGQWVAIATTFDPETCLLTAYRNGVAKPYRLKDPVARDIFKPIDPVPANPYHFPWPVYSPRHFVLKFNGYDVASSGIYEHWLEVDTVRGRVIYGRSCPDPAAIKDDYRVALDVLRGARSMLETEVTFAAVPKRTAELVLRYAIQPGDEIVTSLLRRDDGDWVSVGEQVRYTIRAGAPFTFGRALGLGKDRLDHGTHVALDGVAVFNRVLSTDELQHLSFCKD